MSVCVHMTLCVCVSARPGWGRLEGGGGGGMVVVTLS